MRRRVTVLVLSVCLSVCYHLIINIVHFYGLSKVHTSLFKAFFKNSVQKLWQEKANMQMSSYHSRLVLARFEYILTGSTLSKQPLFSPLCTLWMLLWHLLLVFTYQGRVQQYCSEPQTSTRFSVNVNGSF